MPDQLCNFETGDEVRSAARFRREMFSLSDNLDPGTLAIDEQFDASPNCLLMGMREGEQIMSVIRIHLLDRWMKESPAYDVFPDILGPELDAGFRIVDSSGFCARSDVSSEGAEAAYKLLAVSVHVAKRLAPAKLLATARGKHGLFYRRVFGARLACGPRRYPGRRHPLALYMGCADEVVDLLERRNQRRFLLNTSDRSLVDGVIDEFEGDNGGPR